MRDKQGEAGSILGEQVLSLLASVTCLDRAAALGQVHPASGTQPVMPGWWEPLEKHCPSLLPSLDTTKAKSLYALPAHPQPLQQTLEKGQTDLWE